MGRRSLAFSAAIIFAAVTSYVFAQPGGGGGGPAGQPDMATQAELDAVAAAKISGPASATDNAITLYDGTGGKLAKDSTIPLTTSGSTPTGACSPVGALHINTTTGVLTVCSS